MTIRNLATRIGVATVTTLAAVTAMAGPAAAATRVPGVPSGIVDDVSVNDVLMLPGVGLAAATAEVNLLNAQFALDAAKQSPNTSCALPTVAGYGSVGYDANLVVVRSVDTAAGSGECVNLAGDAFTVSLRLEIVYRSAPGSFTRTGCAQEYHGQVPTNGASAVTSTPVPLVCVHTDPAVFGKEHAVLATVWSSAGGFAQAYSLPWQG